MTHPGGPPGDPVDRQPAWQPYPSPEIYGYPPIAGAYWPPPAHPAAPQYHPNPPQPPPPPSRYAPQAPQNGPAIASLVSSLVGIPAYFLCFGFVGSIVGSILGVVLGIVALLQIGKTGQRGRGMAIAGIVLGAVGLFIAGLALVVAYSSLWS